MKPRNNKDSTTHDFFIDFPITKGKLAEALGVSRSTIGEWSRLALYRIPSFCEAYPKTDKGTVDVTAPLSPYQAWVLVRVGRLINQTASIARVKQAIPKNPNYFSLYTYRTALKNLNKLAA